MGGGQPHLFFWKFMGHHQDLYPQHNALTQNSVLLCVYFHGGLGVSGMGGSREIPIRLSKIYA